MSHDGQCKWEGNVHFLLPHNKCALMWDTGIIFSGETLALFPHCKMDHTPLIVNRAAIEQNLLISYHLTRSLVLVHFSDTFRNCCSGETFLIGTAYMLEKGEELRKPNSWMRFDGTVLFLSTSKCEESIICRK